MKNLGLCCVDGAPAVISIKIGPTEPLRLCLECAYDARNMNEMLLPDNRVWKVVKDALNNHASAIFTKDQK